MISKELLDILVCPACRGDLDYEENTRFTCKACGRTYPIRDGIPIMLVEEDREPAEAGGQDAPE